MDAVAIGFSKAAGLARISRLSKAVGKGKDVGGALTTSMAKQRRRVSQFGKKNLGADNPTTRAVYRRRTKLGPPVVQVGKKAG